MAPVPIPPEMRSQAVTEGSAVYTAPDGQTYLLIERDNCSRVFLNRCPHRHLPLDRHRQVLFTADQRLLVCVNHGAKFHPMTGKCVAGPCVGKLLSRLPELEAPGGAPP